MRAAPYFGDFMLGLPGAVENTRAALAAGVTTIGNLSQHFTFRLPDWDYGVATTEATVTALGLIAAQPVKVLVHSNLDDGFAGLFADGALTPSHRPCDQSINPVPVTENERIPDIDEIIDAQTFASKLVEHATESLSMLDLAPVDALAAWIIGIRPPSCWPLRRIGPRGWSPHRQRRTYGLTHGIEQPPHSPTAGAALCGRP